MDIFLIAEEVDKLTNPTINKGEVEVVKTEALSDAKKLILCPDKATEKYLKFMVKKDKSPSEMALLCGDILPTRCGYTSDNKLYVIPNGGPTLTEGEKVPNNSEFKIKKIHYSDTLEKYILELYKG